MDKIGAGWRHLANNLINGFYTSTECFPHNLHILHRDLLPGLMDSDNSNNVLYDHVEVVQLVNRLTRNENDWNI